MRTTLRGQVIKVIKFVKYSHTTVVPKARSFDEGVIKSRVNAVPRDDDRCVIL